MSALRPLTSWKRSFLFLLFVAGGVVFLDQVTKSAIQAQLILSESSPVIPGFFHLTYILNRGAAFGLLAGASPHFVLPFFWVVTLVVIGTISVYSLRLPLDRQLSRWGLALILGGAVGNLIDRIRFQAVVDFLDFFYGSFHWPAFNLADSAITVGVGLLLLEMILGGKRSRRGGQQDAPAVTPDSQKRGT